MESYYNKSGIYTEEETEGSVCLGLRPEVAEADLLDLLHDFYAIRYIGNGKVECIAELMDELRSHTKWDEWMEIANDKRYECFQQDKYVITSTPYHGGWTSSLTTHIEQIILSIEGKIIMECWGNRRLTSAIPRLTPYRAASTATLTMFFMCTLWIFCVTNEYQ